MKFEGQECEFLRVSKYKLKYNLYKHLILLQINVEEIAVRDLSKIFALKSKFM